jgi:hypothetical protein
VKISVDTQLKCYILMKEENVGHKLFMDNYFSSPHLFSDSHNGKINCCGTVHHDRQFLPTNFGPKTLKLW